MRVSGGCGVVSGEFLSGLGWWFFFVLSWSYYVVFVGGDV